MDSFSGLNWEGSNRPKKQDVTKMTLAERRRIEQVDFESLSSHVSSNSSTARASPAPQNAPAGNPTSQSLLDFDLLASVTSSKPATPQPVVSTDKDEIDDLFDVFNAPVKPNVPEPSVSERAASPAQSPVETAAQAADPRDKALAELLDMGFPIEKASQALDATESGHDLQGAIDFIMNAAHAKTRKPRPPQHDEEDYYREQDRHDSFDTSDMTKTAQEISSQLFMKANSLWSKGRKNLAKAIDDYSNRASAGNSNGMPLWMTEQQRNGNDAGFRDEETVKELEKARISAQAIRQEGREARTARLNQTRSEQQRQKPSKETEFHAAIPHNSSSDFADTAPFQPATSRRPERIVNTPSEKEPPRNHIERSQQRPASTSAEPAHVFRHPTPQLSRSQKFKEQTLIDTDEDPFALPVRPRRKPTSTSSTSVSSAATQATASTVPQRDFVAISSTALDMATISRTEGGELFKLGDFAAAVEKYSQALESIPSNHLLRTIILSNRAAGYLKLGENKAALQDAEEGIAIIGPKFGVGEEAEPGKSLHEIWSKLLSRKAEAQEHMEKFKLAYESWDLLVNNGYSNKQSIEGRRRCKENFDPSPKQSTPRPSRQPTPTVTGAKASSTLSAKSQNQVNRVKEQVVASQKLEQEKMDLLETVEAKIDSWKGGKEDNLRALIASLDTILWPELGWNSISLAELVVPKRVKIAYLKAAAKTHPDKVPSTVSTEQQMIAQGVFITLNKAWDDFKVANGLQ